MKKISHVAGVLGSLLAITLGSCAGNGAVATPAAAPITAGHARYLPTFTAASPDKRGFLMPYQGGPVLLNPRVYLIFWGYKKAGDPDGVAKLLEDFVRAMGGSSHNNIYTQYFDVVNSKTQYIQNPYHQLGGVWFDDKNAVPPEPTDQQVASEALNGVARLGYDSSASYVVAIARGHKPNGFGTTWCAYHSQTYSGGDLVPYTTMPYLPEAGANCGAGAIKPSKDESRRDEGVTIAEGALEGDSVTDPNPGSSWFDFQYGEIDFCKGSISNEPFGNKRYAVRPMYSNATERCVQGLTGPAKTIKGHLFVDDSQRNAVEVLRNGTWQNVGSITNGVDHPLANWVDRRGDLYVANSYDSTAYVSEYGRTGALKSKYSNGLIYPVAIATDRKQNVYAADGFNGVVEYRQGSNTVLASCPQLGGGQRGIAVDSQGDVFVSYGTWSSSGVIAEYKGGLAGCSVTTLDSSFGVPGGIAFDKDGNLLVCDETNRSVDILPAPYSQVSGYLGSDYFDPVEVTINGDGSQAYVTDWSAEKVDVFTYPVGSKIATLGSAEGLNQPIGAVDASNYVP